MDLSEPSVFLTSECRNRTDKNYTERHSVSSNTFRCFLRVLAKPKFFLPVFLRQVTFYCFNLVTLYEKFYFDH